MFSSSGRADPSSMTEVKPAATDCPTWDNVAPWSKCTATGTRARFASQTAMAPSTSRPMKSAKPLQICSMTGAFSASAAAMMALALSKLKILKDPTA